MPYMEVGQFKGKPILRELVDRAVGIEINFGPNGYGTVHGDKVLEAFSPLQKVIRGEWLVPFLVVVQPGGILPYHRDFPEPITGQVRYHLVLQSNPDCWSWHDHQWQQLKSGWLYTMEPSKYHSSVNFGSEDRIHFVVDILEPNRTSAAKAAV